MGKVLVIDDHYDMFTDELESILNGLKEIELPLLAEDEPWKGLKRIDEADVVLLDLKFDDYDKDKENSQYTGFEVLRRVKEKNGSDNVWMPPVIVLTDYNAIENIALAHELGCLFFLDKKFDREETRQIILSALEQGEVEEKRKTRWNSRSQLPVGGEDGRDIVGKSDAMQKVYDRIKLAAQNDDPVLILGETGTGKELIAQAIHYRWLEQTWANENQKPLFVDMNAAAISTDRGLMISELFGCPWGYPNDNDHGCQGEFQRASGYDYRKRAKSATVLPKPYKCCNPGTLFLDEIGEMPYAAQTMLLRVIQEKKAKDLAKQEYDAAPRIICATNRDLMQEIQSPSNVGERDGLFQNDLLRTLSELVEVTGGRHRFRTDLLRRIDVVHIEVPSLEARKEEDLELLIDYFVDRANAEFGTEIKFVLPSIRTQFMQCNWKDKNVRVLENLVRDCVRNSSGQVLALSPRTEEFFQHNLTGGKR